MKDSDVNAVLQQVQMQGLITPQQAQEAATQAQASGTSVLNLIQAQQLVDQEKLAEIKATVLGFPYVHLVDLDIDPDVISTIEHDIAETYHMAPFAKEQGTVSVAMIDPHDFKAVEALDFIARRDGVSFKYFLASQSSIDAVLRKFESLSAEVEEAIEQGEEESAPFDESLDDDATEKGAHSAPVSKMIAVILRYAVEGNASDVHIEPDNDGTRVRYRVDGQLHTSLQVPKKLHNALVARIKVLSNLKLDETRLPQDGRFRMSIESRPVDFRVSTMPLVDQEKVVLRILDRESGVLALEDLGYSDRNLRVIMEQLKRPHGMLLVTGPTGSGKSSTLTAMLQLLNEESRNIITLEDPVEYNIPGISQTQIRPEIDLSFARGLRAILRQDPDVIMVGEIRDPETAELAVHAALTGHILLSTLHTNDAFGAVPRLVDMQIEPFLISSSLNGVIAQRLVRRICEHCIAPMNLPVKMEAEVLVELQHIPEQSLPKDISITPPLKVFKGKGCDRCEDTGYKGRLAISEIIAITPQLEELIAAGEVNSIESVQDQLAAQGMVTLKQDGVIKALRGLTTIEEVWTVTQE